jgi:hypothetical protein
LLFHFFCSIFLFTFFKSWFFLDLIFKIILIFSEI